MKPVFVFKHIETGEIMAVAMDNVGSVDKSWKLVDSLDPVSWIQHNYPKSNEKEIARVLLPNGHKLVKIPFGWQICSIPDES
jgi:hypothetical protein